MTVRRSDTYAGPEMTTPGLRNRTVRLKYDTVREMLDEAEASAALSGRSLCEIGDYLRDHIDDPDVIAVQAHVWEHPVWGPSWLVENIISTPRFNHADSGPNGELIARIVQHDAALALAAHPWGRTRGLVERMLLSPDLRFVSPEAAYVILAYVNAHHPNPRKFLETPDVAAKFAPFAVEIARFPAPGFDSEPGSPRSAP